jgi:hypothetical protein
MVVQTDARVSKVPWTEKLLVAGLLCLEIPFGVVFFPMAAVFVLTGILAPLGMASFALATMPITLAMKRKDGWHSGLEQRERKGTQE